MPSNAKPSSDPRVAGGSSAFTRPGGPPSDEGSAFIEKQQAAETVPEAIGVYRQAVEDLEAGLADTPAIKKVRSDAFRSLFPIGSGGGNAMARLAARGVGSPHAEAIVEKALAKSGVAFFILAGALAIPVIVAAIAAGGAGAIILLLGLLPVGAAIVRMYQAARWADRVQALKTATKNVQQR